MTVESVIGNIVRLGVHVEALAALGAALRLQHSGAHSDPRVCGSLQRVIHAIDPRLVENDALTDGRDSAAVIQTVFRQSIELLENLQALEQVDRQINAVPLHQLDALIQALAKQRGRVIFEGLCETLVTRAKIKCRRRNRSQGALPLPRVRPFGSKNRSGRYPARQTRW